MMNEGMCNSCGNQGLEIFHQLHSVPTNSCILMASEQEAVEYPRGDIKLGFCPECGFISNVAFDAKLTEYSGRYEETQGFSPTFNTFHIGLAQYLIEKYDLRRKQVIEIGCGKGEFLALLCELGENHGTGFDPAYVPDRMDAKRSGRFQVIRDFFSEKYTSCYSDFICCKMTLEHIPRVDQFMSTVRRAIGDRHDTIVFFQVPNATRILEQCAFEDVYYEHCSYFSPGALARAFRRNGFDLLDIGIEYDDQYLTVEAKPADGASKRHFAMEDDVAAIWQHVRTFPDRYREKVRYWTEQLEGWGASGRQIVIWGSGSKGVAFLAAVDPEGIVQHAIDVNPYRRGYYMPGTGQRIMSPEDLQGYKPDVVIVMNPVYRGEVEKTLSERNLHPVIMTL